MGTVYGYAHVSTREQKEDRQMIALAGMQVPGQNIYMDKQSGKDFVSQADPILPSWCKGT